MSKLIIICALVTALLLGGFYGWNTYKTKPDTSNARSTASPTSSPSPLISVVSATPVVPIPSPPVAITVPPINSTTSANNHILMYHYIRDGIDPKVDGLGYRLSIAPSALDSQIGEMKKLGYTPITMAEYATGKGSNRTVTLTFDDGYEDFYTNAFPILKKYGWTATIYVISGKIGDRYMTWEQLKEIDQAGIEIGAHSVTHPNLASLGLESQKAEIFRSKQTIEQNLGISVKSFCYPSGKYNDATIQLVKEAGFTSATTTRSGPVYKGDNPFTLQRLRISPTMTASDLERALHS